jgi:hypothetical protein
MSKTEVYSWRVDADLKQRLEDAAREERVSVGRLLERMARDWLGHKRLGESEEELQRRLHAEAEKYIGTLSLGEGPYTRDRIRRKVRENLKAKRARRAPPRSD